MRQDEKLGGALQNHNQMQLFREVIDECNFMDLGFVVQILHGVNISRTGTLYGRG